MSPEETEKRRSIIDACLKMSAMGINQGTSGNISLRHGDGLLITPTRIPYDVMQPDDIVEMTLDGGSQGKHKPSSEWRFHCDIMRSRPDVTAIVHAHPVYSTAVSIMELDIPPLHYMVAVAGGNNIRCSPYAIYGSQELSDNAIAALEGRTACLLGHHGIITVGHSLSRALYVAGEVETLAKQYLACLQVGGPKLLSEDQMQAVLAKIGGYGHA
jgi:L-fuculose-phosphate aldolase